MIREKAMSIHPSLLALVALLCVGYVLQNIVIYKMRQTIDKQIAISEKQAEASQMLIDAMEKVIQSKGCK